MARESFRQRLVTLAVMVAAGAVASIPAILRSRQLRVLERAYDSLEIGSFVDSTRQPDFVILPGPPPEEYQNHRSWVEEGERSDCAMHGVRRGAGLASNYTLVVGVDHERRVAFKSLGNT